jgi:hypothetical protein
MENSHTEEQQQVNEHGTAGKGQKRKRTCGTCHQPEVGVLDAGNNRPKAKWLPHSAVCPGSCTDFAKCGYLHGDPEEIQRQKEERKKKAEEERERKNKQKEEQKEQKRAEREVERKKREEIAVKEKEEKKKKQDKQKEKAEKIKAKAERAAKKRRCQAEGKVALDKFLKQHGVKLDDGECTAEFLNESLQVLNKYQAERGASAVYRPGDPDPGLPDLVAREFLSIREDIDELGGWSETDKTKKEPVLCSGEEKKDNCTFHSCHYILRRLYGVGKRTGRTENLGGGESPQETQD